MAITLQVRLRKLVNPLPRGKGRLPFAEDRDPILGRRAVAPTQPQATGEGTGLTDLTEKSDVRAYHTESYIKSTDGIFVIVYRDIAGTVFETTDGSAIGVTYVDEPPPA